ncbi:MAG: GGDEF domain-containing protein [Rickettsiales bacterium]
MKAPSLDPQKVKEAASRALKEMESRRIDPLPKHYAVWFEYALGKNKKLIEEIKKAEEGSVTFDAGMHEYMYDKHVIGRNDPNASAEADAKALLANVLQAMTQFSSDTQNYHQEISDQVGVLEKAPTSGDLQSMVKQIISTAHTLKESASSMQQRLEESKQEITGLRENLAKATSEAEHDFLTGVFNRKAFDRAVDELIVQTEEAQSPLCMLMVDIDYFKKFNDEYGHLIGDEVLKMVAKFMKECVKGKDIVARFGGEEFAVILPATPIQGAMIVAENIRRAISSKELKHKSTGESFGTVTVSIGVAAYRHGQDSVPLMIKRADDALYRSKRGGRNKVTQEAVATAA